jgi:hypothetical protein
MKPLAPVTTKRPLFSITQFEILATEYPPVSQQFPTNGEV